jgi:hypothetical protein
MRLLPFALGCLVLLAGCAKSELSQVQYVPATVPVRRVYVVVTMASSENDARSLLQAAEEVLKQRGVHAEGTVETGLELEVHGFREAALQRGCDSMLSIFADGGSNLEPAYRFVVTQLPSDQKVWSALSTGGSMRKKIVLGAVQRMEADGVFGVKP